MRLFARVKVKKLFKVTGRWDYLAAVGQFRIVSTDGNVLAQTEFMGKIGQLDADGDYTRMVPFESDGSAGYTFVSHASGGVFCYDVELGVMK